MDIFRHNLKVAAQMVIIGVLPFFNLSRAYANETGRWLDDYSEPVGLTYGAKATLQAAYLWRGLYVGGLNVQASANVGYGGLYADVWWNIGSADWTFTTFQPEVDIAIGFSRWGADIHIAMIHTFNCSFFDFSNHPEGGNALELGASYTVSSKLPIGIAWATRVGASDGYLSSTGDTIRAYSTYIELFYTHRFAYGISLYGAVGVTPWRSLYTGYSRGFALQNIDIRLRKDWSVSEHCGLMIQGQVTMQPWLMAADRRSVEWHPRSPASQSLNANIALGVYLK